MGRAPGDRGRLSHSHLKTFSVATNEYPGNGKEKAEYPTVVTWDKLAQVCGQYLGKGLRSRARHFAGVRTTWGPSSGSA
jgi:Single-strand binding protein family